MDIFSARDTRIYVKRLKPHKSNLLLKLWVKKKMIEKLFMTVDIKKKAESLWNLILVELVCLAF